MEGSIPSLSAKRVVDICFESDHSVKMEQKVCRNCLLTLPLAKFEYLRGNKSKTYYRNICFSCRAVLQNFRNRNSETYKKRSKESQKKYRENPTKRAYIICVDSRRSDKKRGFFSDIDVEFVKEQISHGCYYCRSASITITLDRIDNTQGHTKDNVLPACFRCNTLKGDMPHAAWLRLVPTIKDIVEEGLFGDWNIIPFASRTKMGT